MIGGYCEEGFPLYYANEDMAALLGYEIVEELAAAIGGKVVNTIHPDNMAQVEKDLGGRFYEGMTYETTYRMLREGLRRPAKIWCKYISLMPDCLASAALERPFFSSISLSRVTALAEEKLSSFAARNVVRSGVSISSLRRLSVLFRAISIFIHLPPLQKFESPV